MSTNHYFSATPDSAPNWREIEVSIAGAPRRVDVAAGVFSHDGLDKGTRILLDEVPTPPSTGNFLDIGSGWGPIALSLALQSPEARVWAIDPNERAREATTRNAHKLSCANVTVVAPAEVPASESFDLIWSNPPIRVGKQVLHEIMTTWIPRLSEGGEAYLVVAKQLGADSLQKWLADTFPLMQVKRFATTRGFRVIRVTN